MDAAQQEEYFEQYSRYNASNPLYSRYSIRIGSRIIFDADLGVLHQRFMGLLK